MGNSVLGTVKDSVPAKKTPNGYVMGEIVASERNRKVGFCTWCQKEIKASAGYGDNWDLVECCYECVKIRNPKK
ncbi:MAG: hypothetical protein LUQ65_15420 [Candidatus Helarchaeota archaeon]|nr:hypothetical protein [Candidatus Helarchaeota archaeon]